MMPRPFSSYPFGSQPARWSRVVAVMALLVVAAPLRGIAQTAENVAVVINDNSEISKRVGEYYVRLRAIPASNVIRIRTNLGETIDRTSYQSSIEAPIAASIQRQRLEDRILYIVLTKDVPLRINGTNGASGSTASVDSELTLLYRRMAGQQTPTAGPIDNPYFLGTKEVREAALFTHHEQDIYLVSRLDAFTADEAIRLVDRAKSAVADGKFVLDERAALVNRTGEDWLELAAKRLNDKGMSDRVLL